MVSKKAHISLMLYGLLYDTNQYKEVLAKISVYAPLN